MNWWHVYVMAIYRDTETARQQLRESDQGIRGRPSDRPAGADSGTVYYQLTKAEFDLLHPCLTLKQILVQNKGLR